MKLYYNYEFGGEQISELIGEVKTNKPMTIEEAMLALGYDINDDADCERGFADMIAGFCNEGLFFFDIDSVTIEN